MDIQFDKSEYREDFYPLCVLHEVWTNEFYDIINNEYPEFDDYETKDVGQKGRLNVRITKECKNLTVLRKKSPSYAKFFDYICSKEFLDKLIEIFPLDLLKSYGFTGSLDKTKVLMDISKATDGYENPFHVDTRGRIFQMLFYLGADEIEEGGELCIAKHKKLDDWDSYPQIPKLSDLEEIKSLPIKDNFGAIILSTPNSYHKGNKLKGVRKFMYVSIDNLITPTWKSKGWFINTKPFGPGFRRGTRA